MALRANARINLAAIERNCARLRARVGESALCAVVKADGYGHGAVQAARAALAGGASWLAVAAAGEAAELRAAGIDARLVVLGALSEAELAVALAADADVVAWSEPFVARLREHGASARVHLELDVGMGRLGTRDGDALLRVGELVAAAPRLTLAGVMTHFPSADADVELTGGQLDRFVAFAERVRGLAPAVVAHAANSAAALAIPASRLDLVRCGIAVYGMDPWGRDPRDHDLEPALELLSRVAAVKPLAPGQTVGYGATFAAREPIWTATLPIGYGDGFRRGFSGNGEVLIGGRRRQIVGRVSMDNVTVALGPEPDAAVGDVAVVIGAAGGERITAEEWAARIDTINYEITTALSSRVTWTYHRDGVEVAP
ncbi:alanine racemase [Conexibacter arvalis]|uniref:Alanine racemase n=1 Tax=Conexibacter arvalis TaxID=912552 RepID=A0A840IC10_9ACTN|nr:alanine racemase [Conexibacter arvalis]MBB4662467.1 alanine racemase [Conexibacter arvalis]